MQSPKVIVAAPHSQCQSFSFGRTCDRVAKVAAEGLASGLQQMGIPVSLHLADRYRSDVDLNRRQARSTLFRERLRSEMQTCVRCALVEVHSFPPDSDFPNVDAVLLAWNPSDQVTQAFQRRLSAYGISTAVLLGSDVNDIQGEAHQIGVPSVLLELNEGLGGPRLQAVINGTVRATADWFTYVT